MSSIADVFAKFTAVDLGRGMASAFASKILVELGVRVVRFAPPNGDPFDAVYPAHRAWQAGKTITTDLVETPAFEAAICAADICLLGGEDLPGLNAGPTADSLLALNPRLVVGAFSDAPAYLGPHRPAVEILAQARAGTLFEEKVDRPVFSALPYASYGAALQLLIALFAALYEREETGNGAVVDSSLFEGALTYATPFWLAAERPTPAFGFRAPKSPQQTIFRCADGKHVQLVLGVPGAKKKLYEVFGLNTAGIDPHDRGIGGPDPQKFYGDVGLFEPLFAARTSPDVLRALTEAGLPNVEVLPPGGCWDDPQVAAVGVLKRNLDGSRLAGLPFAFEFTDSTAPRRTPSARPGVHPLSGVRVLDLGAWVAGPFASVPLADLGAEVIKVEPIEGDPHRFVHGSFAGSNRGKKSIALNLKSNEGLSVLRKLIAVSDIIHHNFRPGVAKKLGIDPASLHAVNPALIALESSAYGQTGPRALQPGFDQLFQAFCGHEVRAAAVDSPPFWSRLVPVDNSAALISSVASVASLLARRRTGCGVTIETSLLQTALFLLSEVMQAADGWVAVAARSDEMAGRFARVLGVADYAPARLQWDSALSIRLVQAARAMTTETLLDALSAADVWAERCNARGLDFLDDSAMLANGTVGRSRHAVYGEVRQICARASIRGRAVIDAFSCPTLGGDTDEILTTLGYSAAEIHSLKSSRCAL